MPAHHCIGIVACMPEIIVYSRRFCAYCTAAKSLLQSKDYPFREISLDEEPELAQQVMERAGQRTVPQIFVGDHSVGGFQELYVAINSGEFENLVDSD